MAARPYTQHFRWSPVNKTKCLGLNRNVISPSSVAKIRPTRSCSTTSIYWVAIVSVMTHGALQFALCFSSTMRRWTFGRTSLDLLCVWSGCWSWKLRKLRKVRRQISFFTCFRAICQPKTLLSISTLGSSKAKKLNSMCSWRQWNSWCELIRSSQARSSKTGSWITRRPRRSTLGLWLPTFLLLCSASVSQQFATFASSKVHVSQP